MWEVFVVEKKINEISVYKNETVSRSDLYTRYKPAFDKLLRVNDFRNNEKKNRDLYIPDDELDQELKYVREEDMDSLSILIGYAGIGKSTALRNTFEYINSIPTYIDTDKILVFPATYNGYTIGENDNKYICEKKIREDILLRIESVNSFLEDKFDKLRDWFDSEEGQLEFYQYIKETNAHVLEHLPYEERRCLSKEEEKKKKLEYAYKYDPFVCAVSKLKYYLGKEACICSKLIVILDDIEPLPYMQQKILIMQYVRFFECLKNTSLTIADKEYVVNVIIGMRPHTYRIMKEYRAFQAFYINREILKRNMVDVSKLFKKKIELYENEIPHENIDAWNSANRALDILCNKFHSHYSNLIKNVSIWNTRDAMEIYQSVLENRIWVQKNIAKTANFVINVDDYVFNNITVLRAIACKNNYVYKPSINGMIPNILYKTLEENYSFLSMCIFEYFHFHDNLDYTYGTNAYTFLELMQIFTETFKGYERIEENAKEIIRYLFVNKILRKSINDTDCPELLDTEQSLKDDSQLYLSPRGYEIWKLIESDSVYFELCREDYYRNYDKEDCCKESSYELFLKGEQKLIFKDLLSILLELLDEEIKFISYAQKIQTIDNYKKLFGTNVMCKHFFIGIMRSVEFSGHSECDLLKDSIVMVEEKIREIETMLR